MSNKQLKAIGLPDNYVSKLNSYSIATVKDLLGKSPMELIKLLGVTLSRVESILDIAFQSCPVEPVTALEVNSKNLNLSQSGDTFEKIIAENDILKRGILCEICGPPGVGKTQFLLKTCILNQTKAPNASTIFIDTENNFNAKRLCEIGHMAFSKQPNSDELLTNMAKHVFVYKVFSTEDLEKKLDRIERDIIEKRVSLLIIDSLASVIRRDFTGACVSTLHERAIYLSKISTKLKTIAEILDVSILLTNQITTFTQLAGPFDKRANKVELESNSAAAKQEPGAIPALGSTWSHFVNIRIILQYIDDVRRELLVTKSPSMPFNKYIYQINSLDGIEFEEGHYSYDGANPSFQRIKIKPYSGFHAQ